MKIFDSIFKKTLLAILAIEIASFFAVGFYRISLNGGEIVNLICFGLITLAIFVLSLKKREYGFYAALLELFIGSKGQLFYVFIGEFKLSIRVAIFVAVMLAWLINLIRSKKTNLFKSFSPKSVVAMAVVIGWGVLASFLNHNELKNLFSDVNAWFYFAYLAVFLDCLITKERLNNVLQIFAASILWIAAKTLILLYLFGHQFSFLHVLYRWVRDTGVGEITLVSGNLFRIFFQSQIFALTGFLLLAAWLFFQNKFDWRKKDFWYLTGLTALSLSAAVVNLSRSNWLGLVAGVLALLVLVLFKMKVGWRKTFKTAGLFAAIAAVNGVLIVAMVYFPWPHVDVDATDMLKDRFMQGSALSSRVNQLQPLTDGIVKHPVIGSGWGTTFTYHTLDPRFLDSHDSDLNTTYASEWGYLDIILKIGLVGLVVYLVFIWEIMKGGWQLLKSKLENDEAGLIVGLMIGLVALMTVHMFSPYLNHPLGIGFILIAFSVINLYQKEQLK
jgi:O-antigen ligase